MIKGAAGRSAIGTLVERTSRYIILVKLDGLSAKDILDGFSRRLREIPPSLRRTRTYGQGSEMALHEILAKRLRMDVFCCDAHSPWQRGSNEKSFASSFPRTLISHPSRQRILPTWSSS